jgi:hypothetical protein
MLYIIYYIKYTKLYIIYYKSCHIKYIRIMYVIHHILHKTYKNDIIYIIHHMLYKIYKNYIFCYTSYIT